MAETLQTESEGRKEDFPVESFLRVEEFVGHLRREAMGRAARFANAITPKGESVYAVTTEAVDFGYEMALRNPSPEMIAMIERGEVES